MSAIYDYLTYYDLTGGINTVASAVYLKPNEARDIQNMELRPIGGFTKRPGYGRLTQTPLNGGITGMYMARFTTSGGTNLFIYIGGSMICKQTPAQMDVDGGPWSDITGALTITDNDVYHWSFAMLNDIVVGGNGVDNSIQVSSAGVASALSGGGFTMTTFKFCVEARGYMFYFIPIVSGTTYYDRCYFSDINVPGTVGANNYINIANGAGGILGGAVEYKSCVYVFKRNGIYQLNYQPTRVNSSGTAFPWTETPNPVVPGVGTQSHRSIVKFTTPSTHVTPGQELMFFVDQFGTPRIFDGRMTLSFGSKIGTSRDTTIKSLADMDNTKTQYIWAENYPDKNYILCFMSEDAANDTCWVMDYSTGFAFTRFKLADNFNAGCLFEKSNGKFVPFFGQLEGLIYEFEERADDALAPIEDYYVTGDRSLRNPMVKNKWYLLDIRGVNGSTTQKTKISYYLDGEDTPTKTDEVSLATTQPQWGAVVWGQFKWGKKGLVNKVLEVNHVSKTLRIKMESKHKTNDSLSIEGWAVAGQALGTAQ